MIPEANGTNSTVALLSGAPAAIGGYGSLEERDTSSPLTLARAGTFFLNLFARLAALAKKIKVRQNRKRLRVCETVPLGDKRFVAVIQVDDQQFLLGGSASSISLLAQLEKPAEFAQVLSARVAEANG
jgi:flagellar biosynthetic protein FliO